MKKLKNTEEKDIQIRKFLKDNLPKERENPWFVKKVLNRLPQKYNRSIVENRALPGAALCVLIAIALQSAHLITSQVLYIKDLVTMGTLLLIFMGLTAWYIAALIRN